MILRRGSGPRSTSPGRARNARAARATSEARPLFVLGLAGLTALLALPGALPASGHAPAVFHGSHLLETSPAVPPRGTAPSSLDRYLPGAAAGPGPPNGPLTPFELDRTFAPPPTENGSGAGGPDRAPPGGSPASPGPRSRGASPAAAPVFPPTGYFTGFINDTGDRLGIAGVSVAVYSSTFCSPSICTLAQTSSNGSYTVICPAGGGLGDDDTIHVSGTNWWFDNETFQTCVAGTTVFVGTMYLVRDGIGIGIARDAATGAAVAGVNFQAVTRDGTTLAYPGGNSQANGSFLLALPPVPAKLIITPPPGYLATFNFTNATPGSGIRPSQPPWGGGINLGVVYLTPMTVVKAELYDSSTLNAVSGTHSALTACDALLGGCQLQGTDSSSYLVFAHAPPGADYFDVKAAGYVETSTPTTTIPILPEGTVFDLGKIWVTPLGTFRLDMELSKPTGGTIPWSPPQSFLGSVYVNICSLDGYFPAYLLPPPSTNLTASQCSNSACANIGSVVTLAAAPLRDSLVMKPDTTGICDPFTHVPQWPIPSNYPVAFPNGTFINLTAGHALGHPNPVYANLTLGDYVSGDVRGAGTLTPPTGGFTVTEATTDNQYWGIESFTSAGGWHGACSNVGPTNLTSFCVPVPPGNSRITVLAPGYASNWTWVHVPLYCCRAAPGTPGYPATLVSATAQRIPLINVSESAGVISGMVVEAGPNATTPVLFGAVQVCPAPALNPGTCGSGFVLNGSFSGIYAPAGMDVVTVSSAGYSSDSVWVNVTAGASETAGTIPLYPLGILQGRVIDPEGNGLYLADVQYCALASAGSCYAGAGTNVGIGTTDTVGEFNGTVPGGWLPWSTYVIVISAPGYTTDWTFGNVSSGGTTTLPTMTLRPIGVNGTARPHPASTPAPSAGTWVTGRLINSADGQGVEVAAGPSLATCLFGSFGCTPVPDGSNAEGFFNGSVPPGLYFLNVTAEGYVGTSVFFNATQAGFLDLGVIELTPDWWVSGRIIIHPWASITLSDGGTFGMGYAPAATVQGCDTSGANCLNAVPVATNGTFNVSVPIGPQALLLFNPSGAAAPGTAPGGFNRNRTGTNLSENYTELSGSNLDLPLDIFGTLYGTIWNNDTAALSANGTVPVFGVPYAQAVLSVVGNNSGFVSITADGDGAWVAFVPAGNGPNTTTVGYQALPGYLKTIERLKAPILAGEDPQLELNATLARLGWIAARFIDPATGGPVPYVAAMASYTDPVSGLSYGPSDTGDDNGFLNLTAPIGSPIQVTVTAPDFNGTRFLVPRVNGSATSFVNGTNYSDLTPFPLPAYGYFFSDSINFSGDPPPLSSLPDPIVVDPVNGLGLPGALVSVSSSDPNVPAGSSSPTNWAGQFYSDAPIGRQDTLEVQHLSYQPNSTRVAVASGSYHSLVEINMTGDTVVAGRVIGEPGGRPISGASLQVCEGSSFRQICTTAFTNVTGVFWVAIAPGDLTLSATADGFVGASFTVSSCPDCWVPVGTVPLAEYGFVQGSVRGLPSGFPISGANASLCAPDGSGTCGPSASTGAFGGFIVSAPAGSYLLTVTDPNFNTTVLPIDLAAGETATVGTVFLSQFGTATGTVYDRQTSRPLMGATVLGCAAFSEGTCAPSQTTDYRGQYRFSAAPGPYSISVGASGYHSQFGGVTIASGTTTVVSGIELQPIGTNAPLEVSGRVVDAGDPSTGIAGAVLTALVNGSAAVSTVAGTDGGFSLYVAFGTYQVEAAAPGYAPLTQTVLADQAISGLLFELSPMEYPVTGIARDGLTGTPLAGVSIWSARMVQGALVTGAELASTGSDGRFDFALSNGTHALVAFGPSEFSDAYAALPFIVDVNGVGTTHDLSMTPTTVSLRVQVVDDATGLPLPGAVVSVLGRLSDGFRLARTYATGPDGSLAIPVYVGSYALTASHAPYRPSTVPLELTSNSSSVTIRLHLVSPTALASNAPGLDLLALGGGILAVVLVAAYLVTRPRPPAPPRTGPLRDSVDPYRGGA